MDKRKKPGRWVQPRFDPDQRAFPPASPRDDPALETTWEDDPLRARGRAGGVLPTGPLIEPDPRQVWDDDHEYGPARTAARLEGRHRLRPRATGDDPARPD